MTEYVIDSGSDESSRKTGRVQRVRSITNPHLHRRPSAFFCPDAVDLVADAQRATETQITTLA